MSALRKQNAFGMVIIILLLTSCTKEQHQPTATTSNRVAKQTRINDVPHIGEGYQVRLTYSKKDGFKVNEYYNTTGEQFTWTHTDAGKYFVTFTNAASYTMGIGLSLLLRTSSRVDQVAGYYYYDDGIYIDLTKGGWLDDNVDVFIHIDLYSESNPPPDGNEL
jgi:hypothetical protein